MITYLKNKKRRTVVIFLALFLLAFFCFLKTNQNSSGVPISLDTKRKLLNNENKRFSQNYAELEISDETAPRLHNENNNENNNTSKAVNTNNEKNLPKLLEIPKIGVGANVQSVGLNSKNEMDVPSNDYDVAWFNLGTVPGKKGSAVIAGHLDGRTGQPAVFWDVRKLKTGDDIYITDSDNNKKRFQVISVEKYETGNAPMEKIFGANDGIYLNLVTCGGTWDKAKNNYTERLVVFTEYSS